MLECAIVSATLEKTNLMLKAREEDPDKEMTSAVPAPLFISLSLLYDVLDTLDAQVKSIVMRVLKY